MLDQRFFIRIRYLHPLMSSFRISEKIFEMRYILQIAINIQTLDRCQEISMNSGEFEFVHR